MTEPVEIKVIRFANGMYGVVTADEHYIFHADMKFAYREIIGLYVKDKRCHVEDEHTHAYLWQAKLMAWRLRRALKAYQLKRANQDVFRAGYKDWEDV